MSTVLAAPVTTAAPGSRRARLLPPVLVYVGLLVAVVSSLGSPLVPTIATDYGVSLGSAQWTLTVTLLVGALAAPVIGRLGDGPWRRTVLLSVLAVVVAGSVLAALPGPFALLLAGRAGQGTGLALLPLAMSVARDHLPADDRRGQRPHQQGHRERPLGAAEGDAVVGGDRRDQRRAQAADDRDEQADVDEHRREQPDTAGGRRCGGTPFGEDGAHPAGSWRSL
jgi:hypothetical protein